MDEILELFPTPDACAAAIGQLVIASGVALSLATHPDHGTFHDSDDGHDYWGCCSARAPLHADTCWTHELRAALKTFGVEP